MPVALANRLDASPPRIQDQLGRTVRLTDYPGRIATIPMPLAPLLLALHEGSDQLVAMHPESRTAVEGGAMRWLYPEAMQLPTDIVGRGFMPNVEALLSIAPDLVVQWGGRGAALLEPLERAGLTTAAMVYAGREADIRGWLRLMGALTGHPARAEQLLGLRDSVHERLRAALASADTAPPRVLYLFRARSGLQAGGRDSYMHYAIELAGGVNVAAALNGTRPVGAEQILAWEPDIILLNSFEAGLTPAVVYEDPLLALTPAAQQRAVHVMPVGGYRWDPPSHESPLAWLWLAQQFWGNELSLDYRREAVSAVGTLYGEDIPPQALAALTRPFARSAATTD